MIDIFKVSYSRSSVITCYYPTLQQWMGFNIMEFLQAKCRIRLLTSTISIIILNHTVYSEISIINENAVRSKLFLD